MEDKDRRCQNDFFFCLMQNQKQKQNKKLKQFKIFCTGSKHFVLVQKLCTGSEKIVPKAKVELQHILFIVNFGDCTIVHIHFVVCSLILS